MPDALVYRLLARAAVGVLNGLGVSESLWTDDDPTGEKAGERQIPIIDKEITALEGEGAPRKAQQESTSAGEDA